jgi:hypothetical protein
MVALFLNKMGISKKTKLKFVITILLNMIPQYLKISLTLDEQ